MQSPLRPVWSVRGCTLESMRSLVAGALLGCLVSAGCHSAPQPAAQASSDSNFKVYHLRGKIVGTDPSTGEVNIDADAIAGFMDAMTMPYKLKNPGVMSDLHPGDTITADVFVSQGSDGAVLLDHIVVIAQAKPDYKPTLEYHVPAPGDNVPDFALHNQDNRAIHLNQFRGKALLITFIYTRCPLPNFCPLVTRNFAVIDKTLRSDAALYNKVHLLSVSFDPEHDTAQRSSRPTARHTSAAILQRAFSHWDFATTSLARAPKNGGFTSMWALHTAPMTPLVIPSPPR